MTGPGSNSILVVSKRTLRVLAALLWYCGSAALLLKAAELLERAGSLGADGIWLFVSVALGMVLGLFKGRLLFRSSCVKNLRRIDELTVPKIYQFYRPLFFLFLATMVIVGGLLSRLSGTHPPFVLSVAVLDLSIAVALLTGGGPFWMHRRAKGGRT